MQYALEATYLLSKQGGIARYSAELARALVAQGCAAQLALWSLRTGRAVPPELADLPLRQLPVPVRFWRFALLASHLLDLPLDRWLANTRLFHGVDHVLPRLHHTAGVVTVHDLAYALFPEQLNPLNRWFLRVLVPRSVRRARRVITVSAQTQADLVRLTGIHPQKVRVIYHGIHPRFRPWPFRFLAPAAHQRHGVEGPYFLFVGTIEPRKNVDGLLEAYARFRQQGGREALVVAGLPGWRCAATLARLRTSPGVHWLPHVADQELPELYAGAIALVHVACHEGFGFPPLEAMACGTPVIAASTGALPEILGDAAHYVAWNDPEAIAARMALLAENPAERETLRTLGQAQAARFRWEETARQTLAVYEEALQ
jgi:glycosyltransferase involved in cell wall biosynthesis